METRYFNVEPFNSKANGTNKTKAGLTPRELIHYHMNNPDEPISDEDMENLVLSTGSTAIAPKASLNNTDNRMPDANTMEQIKDNPITTPYDILDR